MPTNKNALLRYKVLDRCFRNKYQRHNVHSLVIEVIKALRDLNSEDATIDVRTIQNDIRFMKSLEGYNAPIKTIRKGRLIFYRYSDPSFSIFSRSLKGHEHSAVNEMYNIISSFDDRVEFSFLKEILYDIDPDISKKVENEVIVSYDDNQFLRNHNLLGVLFNAIKSKQSLDIDYRPFGEEIQTLTIHPHFLKQYNNRWFLFALNEEYNKKGIHPVIFALDRIVQIRDSDLDFVPNKQIEYNTYFNHIIGVTKPEGKFVIKITFEVSEKLKPYLETKPLHASQKQFVKRGEMFKSSIQVIPNYEMYSLFLSYGAEIKILKPSEVVNEFKSLVKSMQILYEITPLT